METIKTTHYQLDMELGDRVGRITLKDAYTGVAFADSDYRYSAFAEYEGNIYRLEGLYNPQLTEEPWKRGGRRVSISGTLGNDSNGPKIVVRHRLYIPELGQDYFEERVILHNQSESAVILRGYRFGFRKCLQTPERYGGTWQDVENYRFVAIPYRLQPDGKKHDYPFDDVYHGRYQCSVFQNNARLVQEVVDIDRGRSEAWVWTDGENGLLVIKHNPDAIEFSMLSTERDGDDAYVNFGGAAPSLYNEPVDARVLAADAEFTFGKTRYQFYEGLWRQGAYLFRDYMSALGHGVPDNYDPPVTWNELYNVGWHDNNRESLKESYNLDALLQEAEYARDMGCGMLYLDPGWEACEGGTRWDEERLGDVREFVRRIREEYGLKVGFRTIGRSYCDEWPGMYRLRSDGSTGYYAPYSRKPFYEPCFCSEQYQEEKLKRILAIADAGMDFIMFDEFDWRGPCSDITHGHPTPTTPDMHARAVADLVRKVHEKHPDLSIEMHDPIWPWGVRYLPGYYLHDQAGCFDEHWGFEFMWNPLEDVLSGNAFSLFYYNLAYSLPMYLHIDMNGDNDNCLAFWWFASTVRHLGIGGGKSNPVRYQAYKQAMAQYNSLKDLYTRGKFYGLDELTHIHVLPEEDRGVINVFNLTDKPVSRQIDIRPNAFGLMENIRLEGAPYEKVKNKLVLSLEIPPFSPVVVRMVGE